MTQEQYDTIIEKLDKISGNQVILEKRMIAEQKELISKINLAKDEMLYDIEKVSSLAEEIKRKV